MSKVRLFSIFLVALALSIAASANSVEFCTGSIVNGYVSGNSWTTGGIVMSTAPDTPDCKTSSYLDPLPGGSVTGLGVSGKTAGEIDYGEFVTLDFGGSVNLESFEITLLYNGPEFGDPAEGGYVDVWFTGALNPLTYYFQASPGPTTTTLLTDLGGSYTNISPMTGENAGWFRFDNPFGDRTITKLSFTAANNPNGTNNSDYSLKSVVYSVADVEQVPEPATYAMLGLGLLAVGFLKRRKA